MGYILGVISGILLGVLFTMIFCRHVESGTLKVYTPDDPEESPYLYVELDKPISFIGDQSHVTFKVDVKTIKTQQ